MRVTQTALEPKMFSELSACARRRNVSISAMIRAAVERMLESERRNARRHKQAAQ